MGNQKKKNIRSNSRGTTKRSEENKARLSRISHIAKLVLLHILLLLLFRMHTGKIQDTRCNGPYFEVVSANVRFFLAHKDSSQDLRFAAHNATRKRQRERESANGSMVTWVLLYFFFVVFDMVRTLYST